MKPLDRRQQILGLALVATLGATAWSALQREDEPAQPTAGERRARPATAVKASGGPAALLPSDWQPRARQPWAEAPPAQLAAWQPPPPPPAPKLPPAPPAPPAVAATPVAPPLPYQMIGRVVEGEGARAVEVALLSGPSRSLGARRGDVIDGQWRVEQVSSAGVRLTWLPGQLPQQIAFKTSP